MKNEKFLLELATTLLKNSISTQETALQNNNIPENNEYIVEEPLFEINKKYYCETYTKYYTFVFKGYAENGFIVVDNLVWVADTGRYHKTFSNDITEDSFEETEVVTLKGKKFLKVDAMVNIMNIPLIITKSK